MERLPDSGPGPRRDRHLPALKRGPQRLAPVPALLLRNRAPRPTGGKPRSRAHLAAFSPALRRLLCSAIGRHPARGRGLPQSRETERRPLAVGRGGGRGRGSAGRPGGGAAGERSPEAAGAVPRRYGTERGGGGTQRSGPAGSLCGGGEFWKS